MYEYEFYISYLVVLIGILYIYGYELYILLGLCGLILMYLLTYLYPYIFVVYRYINDFWTLNDNDIECLNKYMRKLCNESVSKMDDIEMQLDPYTYIYFQNYLSETNDIELRLDPYTYIILKNLHFQNYLSVNDDENY